MKQVKKKRLAVALHRALQELHSPSLTGRALEAGPPVLPLPAPGFPYLFPSQETRAPWGKVPGGGRAQDAY